MNLFVNEGAYDGVIGTLAQQHAPGTGLAPDTFAALVKAVIRQESAFDPAAYHYDQAYERAHNLPADPVLNASYGLMQIEGSTARGLGLTGDVRQLYDPTTNLQLGVPFLASLLKRYHGAVLDAVAAYNAGSARRTTSGAYVNQPYVDAVSRFYDYYRTLPLSGGSGAAEAGVFAGVPWWALVIGGGGLLAMWLLSKHGGA